MMPFQTGYAHVVFLTFLTVASLYFNITLINTAESVKSASQSRRRPRVPSSTIESYSFIGSDRPKLLPVVTRNIKVTVEESVHYPLTGPQAHAEWLWTAPLGDNDIRLGPEKRVFAVAMFHQLHCLRGMRDALEGGFNSLTPVYKEHLHHCFNYLRKYTLCSADVTLEPGDFTKRNFTTERIGATHTCRDWDPVYEMVGEKWFEWTDFREANGIPRNEDMKR